MKDVEASLVLSLPPSPALRLYRAAAFPLMRAAFRFAGLFNSKIQKGLAMRAPGADGLEPWMRAPENLRPIWFHCSSGEFEYAKPVIREIKRRWPRLATAVTYFSPTAEKPVSSFEGVDFSCPSPWDEPGALSAFIERTRPRALLIARTDAWPEMAEQARAYGVPSLLFSATLTASSRRSAPWARAATRLSLEPLAAIHCVGEQDCEEFAKLGFAGKTSICGDARYDQVLARLAQPKAIRDELFDPPGAPTTNEASAPPTLIAGSTWPQDEGPLIEAAVRLKGRVRFCLVPHEPSEAALSRLEGEAERAGIPCVRYSTARRWPEGALLLVDQVGILAELYAKGQLAFVGGSFRKTVHSVMEPLACGARVLIGPLHLNNREAVEFQKIDAGGLAAVVACADGAQIASTIERALATNAAEAKQAIQAAVRARAGAAVARAVDWVAARGDVG